MSMSRKVEDKINKQVVFMLLKIDLGSRWNNLSKTINTNTGFIQIYETNTQVEEEHKVK